MSEHKQKEIRMNSIEERLARLEEVSDTNARVFSDSLELAEVCIQALQRALDDVLKDALGGRGHGTTSLKVINIEDMTRIDFKAYLNAAMAARSALVEKIQGEPAQESGQEGEQVVFEFGG